MMALPIKMDAKFRAQNVSSCWILPIKHLCCYLNVGRYVWETMRLKTEDTKLTHFQAELETLRTRIQDVSEFANELELQVAEARSDNTQVSICEVTDVNTYLPIHQYAWAIFEKSWQLIFLQYLVAYRCLL